MYNLCLLLIVNCLYVSRGHSGLVETHRHVNGGSDRGAGGGLPGAGGASGGAADSVEANGGVPQVVR